MPGPPTAERGRPTSSGVRDAPSGHALTRLKQGIRSQPGTRRTHPRALLMPTRPEHKVADRETA